MQNMPRDIVVVQDTITDREELISGTPAKTSDRRCLNKDLVLTSESVRGTTGRVDRHCLRQL